MLAIGLMVEGKSGIDVRDAVGGSFGALPTLTGIKVGAGPSDKGFDGDGFSLLDTRAVGVRQNQADKAKSDSDKKKAKKESFGKGIQVPR
jgi:hypothetical protein